MVALIKDLCVFYVPGKVYGNARPDDSPSRGIYLYCKPTRFVDDFGVAESIGATARQDEIAELGFRDRILLQQIEGEEEADLEE